MRLHKTDNLITASIAALVSISALPAIAQSSSSDSSLQVVSKSAVRGDAAPVTLTLKKTIELALSNSTGLAVTVRNLDKDQAIIGETKSQAGPTVGLSATGTHYDSPTILAFGGANITYLDQDMLSGSASAQLPIDISGTIRASQDIAHLQYLADSFGRDAIVNDISLQAQIAYYGVLRAEHDVQVAEASLKNAQTQQNLVQEQYDHGTGQKVDLLRANTQVSAAQNDLIDANNNFSIAKINLNDFVGRPLNAPVTVVDVEGVTSGISLEASSQPESLHFFKAPLEDVSAIDLDKSIDTAVKARPELRQDLVNIQAASKSIKLARASLEPSLALSADAINYANATMATPRQKMAQIGLTLNIPIYDSGLAHEKVREAKDSEASAKDVYDAHITDVGRQVREAYLNIQSAAKQIEAADVALEHAAAARQLAQTRYEGGVGLYIDVTDAQQALASAETNQVNSVYNYLIAKAQFQHAVGVSEAAVETKASAKSSR